MPLISLVAISMNSFLPPPSLQASVSAGALNRPSSSLPDLVAPCEQAISGRRGFLRAATVAVAAFGAHNAWGSSKQLIFAPDEPQQQVDPFTSPTAHPLQSQQPMALGEIPSDFWYHPRELWLRRNGTKEESRVVYWKDGQLLGDGYWAACALLRDVRANKMTAVDPAILDVLRGLTGYYQAWRWPHPVVVNSGFRTIATNNALSREGAAKNSMHLYGRAVDVVVPGVPARDVGVLAASMRQGGVGFYPSKKFTHVDTGKMRTWVSR